MEALLFIKPVYLFLVSATYWACYGNVVCLRSNVYDWLFIPIRWDFHWFLSPLCRNSSMICTKTIRLAVACNVISVLDCPLCSPVLSCDTVVWRFMKQKGGTDIIPCNWGTGLVTQNIFDTITLTVLFQFSHCLWRHLIFCCANIVVHTHRRCASVKYRSLI
jgi:hypothetical protein